MRLSAVGIEFTAEDLDRLGRVIHAAKYSFKFREGYSPSSARLPERIFKTPCPSA